MISNALYNRAKMTVSGTPGTGAITVGSAVAGFQTFSAAGVTNGTVVSYVIEDTSNTWEIGQGTYSSGVLTRTKVIASSSSGSAISATSSAIVYLSALATDINRSANRPLSANFTAVQVFQSGAGVVDDPNGMCLYAPATNGSNTNYLNVALKPVPSAGSTGWRVDFHVRCQFPVTNYMSFGPTVYNSATGLYEVLTVGGLNGVPNATYFNADQSFNQTVYLAVGGIPALEAWYRVEIDGTYLNFYFSGDGYRWSKFYTVVYASTFIGGVPTHIGLGFNANNGGGGGIVAMQNEVVYGLCDYYVESQY